MHARDENQFGRARKERVTNAGMIGYGGIMACAQIVAYRLAHTDNKHMREFK
jgi:hypothetical protein